MAITLWLDGIEYTSSMEVDTLSITDTLNSRNTCSLDLIEPNGALIIESSDGSPIITSDGDSLLTGLRPSIGQAIQVKNGSTVIFAGTIDDLDEEKFDGSSNAVRFAVSCVDNNALADRHLVARAYETPGQTLADIVGDIVTQDLAGEGITTTYVQTGPTIDKAVFNYRTAAEAFNDLSEVTGYAWWIDYNKVLHFCARETNAAPFALGDATANFRNLRVRTTRERYRNRQYIRAGKDLTDSRAETFKGDGERRTFTLAFPVGKVPTSITVNAAAKTIGIRGLDTGKDWYWNKDSSEITQDDGGTKLTSSDTLSVTYQGLFPLNVVAQDDAQISAMAAAEGGTGVYEAIEDAASLDSEALATDKANGLLRRFGRIPRIVTFETDTDGLSAGQLLPIDLTAHGLSGSYLIDDVQTSDVGGKFLRYRVRCLDGESLGGWESFFRATVEAGRRFVVRENEVLTYMRSQRETVTLTDTLTATTGGIESRADYALAGYSEAA